MPTILRCKCLIVGDSTVGKSSITQVFHSDSSHFPKNYIMTQGVELLVKPVNIPESADSVVTGKIENCLVTPLPKGSPSSTGSYTMWFCKGSDMYICLRSPGTEEQPLSCEVRLPWNTPLDYGGEEFYLYDCAGKDTFLDIVQKFWDQPSVIMVVYDCTNENSFSSCTKWLEKIKSQNSHLKIPGALVANKIDLEQRRTISPKQGRELAQSHKLEYFECSAKEMQHVDVPFFFLANEFHKLYQERVELFSTLA